MSERIDHFEDSPAALLVTSPGGQIQSSNRTFSNWVGYSPHQLIGKRFQDLLKVTGRILYESHFAPVLRLQGHLEEVALEIATRDGDAVPVLLSAVEVRDSNERAVSIRIALSKAFNRRNYERDLIETRSATEAARQQLSTLNAELQVRIAEAVAERMRAEEALRQSQKMEAIGQLTGGVAHDFNNLLTIIRSSVDLLQLPNLREDRRRRYLTAISETVDRSARMIGQLLAFARRQPLNAVAFDVGNAVEQVVDLIRPVVGNRVRINSATPERPLYAFADTSQFETALVNLAINARDAMQGEGTLSISVEAVAAIPPIRAQESRIGQFVKVSVADTGTGIEEEVIDTIFEPFFTTKGVGKGTGLGLSQVFGFSKQSKGEVQVESSIGVGTTFKLFLPQAESITPMETIAASEHVYGEGASILLVEDNEAVGHFSTELLNDLGYTTTLASTATEALSLLDHNPSAYELVFTDVVMPGMNGLDLARSIRRRHPSLPILLTSGYGEVLVEEGLHGFELVQKPYSVETLSAILQKVLRR